MNVKWGSLNDAQKAAAADMFDALTSLDTLSRPAVEPTTVRITRQRLFIYASGLEGDDDQAVADALGRDPALADDLQRILDMTALYRFPRVAAASSGAVKARDGEGFSLRLKSSRAAPDQTYVTIELEDPNGTVPSALFVQAPGQPHQRHTLGPVQDGAVQILAETSSPLVRALQDPKTEVYLR